jgi:hypothetical protein
MIAGFVVVDVARDSRLPSLPQEQRCRNVGVRTVLQKTLPLLQKAMRRDHRPLNTVESSNSTKAVASSQKAFGAATLR